MELLVTAKDYIQGRSLKSYRPFEHYAYPAGALEGPRHRHRCWVTGQLWIFRPPEGWSRSWLHNGSPDTPTLHGLFWPHSLGPDRELIDEDRKENLHRIEQWAKNKLRHVARERDTAGLRAVLIVSPSPLDPGK